jgi:hypothetical protein
MKKDYKGHRISSTAVQNSTTKLFGAKVIILEPPGRESSQTAHEFDVEAKFQTASEAEACGMLWATERVDLYATR